MYTDGEAEGRKRGHSDQRAPLEKPIKDTFEQATARGLLCHLLRFQPIGKNADSGDAARPDHKGYGRDAPFPRLPCKWERCLADAPADARQGYRMGNSRGSAPDQAV